MKKKLIGGISLDREKVRKILMIMRLIVLLFFASLIHVSASVYSQKTKLNIRVENASLQQVFKVLQEQSEFDFFYKNEQIPAEARVSIQYQNESIEVILDKILTGTGLTYHVLDKDIVISNKGAAKSDMNLQQQKSVSGKVADSSGGVLPGVSVVVKGTTNGTITDGNGNYSLHNVPENAVLQFSFVGMKGQEVVVGSKTMLNIIMEEETVGVEEVVVVGYGTQKKVNLTGSVSSVSADVLEARPVQNVGQALQGIVPGLNFNTAGLGGELNQNLSFNIRGAGTIGAGSNSSPLVLIDGMEGNLNALNPQDIESISVLKDAAAASIYGSRAPFGVILITTKSGKSGKTTVNYNNNFRWTAPMGLPKMMDSYTFALYWNEAAANSGEAAKFSQEAVDRILKYQNGEIDYSTVPDAATGTTWQMYTGSNANTDWFKEHYKSSAYAKEHSISMNGGNEAVNYYLSGNYLDQDGLSRYSGDNFQRYSFTAKFNAQVGKYVKFKYNSKFIREDYQEATHQTDLFFPPLAYSTRQRSEWFLD